MLKLRVNILNLSPDPKFLRVVIHYFGTLMIETTARNVLLCQVRQRLTNTGILDLCQRILFAVTYI
jgi:hypothetical protein